MRRLVRHLLTLCSAFSLVLCVAVCVLWAASYDAADTFYRGVLGPGARPTFEAWCLDSNNGNFLESRIVAYATEPDGYRQDSWPNWDRVDGYTRATAHQAQWRSGDVIYTLKLGRTFSDFGTDRPIETPYELLSLGYRPVPARGAKNGPPTLGVRNRGVVVGSHRNTALLAAVLPALWSASRIARAYCRRRRRHRGLCRTCGYDLRASPERCPECGASASAATV